MSDRPSSEFPFQLLMRLSLLYVGLCGCSERDDHRRGSRLSDCCLGDATSTCRTRRRWGCTDLFFNASRITLHQGTNWPLRMLPLFLIASGMSCEQEDESYNVFEDSSPTSLSEAFPMSDSGFRHFGFPLV
ncbi:hypothetical protein LIA77_08410 [Sarocladium implicatum]|nr:hypothetical protein LIA77_08410 [Sarocladium implicatum]